MGAPTSNSRAQRTRPQSRRPDPPQIHQRRPRPSQPQDRRGSRHLPDPQSPYLDYPTALKQGWPIATGIIEGACRHIVKDRMDITGARWGLAGAEAVLKLRAIKANGDFNQYWHYHLNQERQHVHQTRYHNHTIPQAA